MKKHKIYIKPKIVIHKMMLEVLQVWAASVQKEEVIPGQAEIKDDEKDKDNDYRQVGEACFIEDDWPNEPNAAY